MRARNKKGVVSLLYCDHRLFFSEGVQRFVVQAFPCAYCPRHQLRGLLRRFLAHQRGELMSRTRSGSYRGRSPVMTGPQIFQYHPLGPALWL